MPQETRADERQPEPFAGSGRWLPEVYEELRSLAAARMTREADGLTLQPTALVHEAWIKLTMRDDRKWNDREHFFRSAALAMRRILVESARRKRRRSSALQSNLKDEGSLETTAEPPEDRLLRIDETLKKLEQQDPESARVVILKFFGGLTNREVAESLGVTERTVERQWAYARSTMLTMIRSEEKPGEYPS
jgi:RNA polymerase sigma factor (TIGR02999 family)